jgi:hypothetical protein
LLVLILLEVQPKMGRTMTEIGKIWFSYCLLLLHSAACPLLPVYQLDIFFSTSMPLTTLIGRWRSEAALGLGGRFRLSL